ncbi:MAG: NAD(P)/FAD-dependent oxidoreductase [Solirubrobacteraceae bacterium]
MGADEVRLAIVGSGFAGLGMAVNLKRAGIDDFAVLERADDVGGTWRDNTYPGCQCDVPSTLYSFSFAPNPAWTHTYPLQGEIWAYLRRVADEFGVTPHIRFDHPVVAAAWDQDSQRWALETPHGTLRAQVLVLATGLLSEPAIPSPVGLERFGATTFHSAAWDHKHELAGKRVAVIGTGASAIQFVPKIQPRVAQLQIYQRTPPWIMPHPDRPTTRVERAVWNAMPRSQHASRVAIWAARESLVLGLAIQPRLMGALEAAARAHLRAQISDPDLRRRLTPRYRLGCKRMLISDDYYPALRESNVELIEAGVQEIRPRSLLAGDGSEREVDTIIFATGFRVTTPPFAAFVRGRDGMLLADAWNRGMSAYLGTTIAGFPNAFMLVGPNTGLGHSSMIYMIESQIAYVMDALRTIDRAGAAAVDVRREVQAAYNDELQQRLARTVWNAGGCRSWYLDASGRNTTLWPSFTFAFRERTRRFKPSDYVLSRPR